MSAPTTTDAAEVFRREPDRMIDVGDGAAVAHRQVGTGPDVLFVHGWPVSGATYRTLLPHLADHVTCHVIDLPGAGSSTFSPTSAITVAAHVERIRRVVDVLGLDDVAVVGHDSGGLLARHALAGDDRVRAWGLLDTEQPHGLTWRFKQFLLARHLPGFGAALGWLVGAPRLRRNPFVLGGAFIDRALLDGEFDEFFLAPIHEDPTRRAAAVALLRSFDVGDVEALDGLHRRIDVPVQLVWGAHDPFFPVAWAREMAASYPDTSLEVIEGAGLFVHEERPAETAAALLPALTAGR